MASTNGADSISPTVPPSYPEMRDHLNGHYENETYLYDANIGLLIRVVYGNLRDALDPILDGVCNMGDDLQIRR